MAPYDPKRPRPSAGETEEPAPVEAMLSPEPVQLETAPPEPASPEPVSAEPVSPEPVSAEPVSPGNSGTPDEAEVEVDLRVVASNGSASKAPREVPVAPAPEQGTANRALLAAAAGSAAVLALVVAVLWRRRRRSRSA